MLPYFTVKFGNASSLDHPYGYEASVAVENAREIIANAIENLAYEFTMESTLSTVQLPSEKYKGMIIGREGRNIRAFDEISGVKVIVVDTPEMIVLSAFDPVQ